MSAVEPLVRPDRYPRSATYDPLAMSTPALRLDPYDAGVPSYVSEVVGWEAAAWHPPDWWRRHWELSGLVVDVEARWQEGGRDDWLTWARAHAQRPGGMLEADVEEQIGFALVTARRR